MCEREREREGERKRGSSRQTNIYLDTLRIRDRQTDGQRFKQSDD